MSLKPKTLAVHAGTRLEGVKARPLVPPVHVSAVSSFDDADDLDASLDGKDYVYGRIAAQNAAMLEDAVAALEGAEACAAFPSGMAAIRAVLEAQELRAGEVMAIASDGYGATLKMVKQLCAERGVALHALPLAAPDAPARLRALRPKLVLAESMTNPLLAVPDLPALADACHAVGAVLAVDATFPSPALQQSCALGADYAIQSTTKWMNGHSDAVGGTVSGTAARILPLRAARILHGAIIGPFEAWLTLRGLRTLPLRMAAHSEHAEVIAGRLALSPLLKRVHYPGLPDDPHHSVAKRVLRGGFGGMLAFEIKDVTRRQAFAFLEAVKLCVPAPSLGDVCTLVMHPATASARRMTAEERAAAGIGEALIRVSVGLEDPEDVADDLLQAVARAREATP